MGFAVLPYSAATGGSITDGDITCVADPDFSNRNSHFIFTEQFKLACVAVLAANVSRVNIQVPTWNAIGRFNVWPLNKSANIPSPPQVMWLRQYMPNIPMNEEFTIKATDSASEQFTAFIWIVTNDWTANQPAGKLTIPVRVTASPTLVANSWSALNTLTFEQSLRGGTYAVMFSEWQGAGVQLVRIVFPKYKLAYGIRKLRPGWLAQQSIGDLEEPAMQINPFIWGEWGRFFTFEPPQIEVFGNTSGAISLEGRMWLEYLGESDMTSM